jgi:hypothetical protein
MEVTGRTLREPIGTAGRKDSTERRRHGPGARRQPPSETRGFRIAFDNRCPQYLSEENE